MIRSPLTTVIAGLLLTVGFVAPASTASASDPTAQPSELSPSELYGIDLPTGRILPVRGVDLPVNGSSTSAGTKAYTLDPQVQAIPTPTGADTALTGLAALVTARLLTRRRPKLG